MGRFGVVRICGLSDEYELIEQCERDGCECASCHHISHLLRYLKFSHRSPHYSPSSISRIRQESASREPSRAAQTFSPTSPPSSRHTTAAVNTTTSPCTQCHARLYDRVRRHGKIPYEHVTEDCSVLIRPANDLGLTDSHGAVPRAHVSSGASVVGGVVAGDRAPRLEPREHRVAEYERVCLEGLG